MAAIKGREGRGRSREKGEGEEGNRDGAVVYGGKEKKRSERKKGR